MSQVRAPSASSGQAMGHPVCGLVRELGSRSWVCGEEGVDLVVFGFGEAEGCGGDDAFDLFSVTAADDGCCDGWVVERPRDSDDTSDDFVAGADGLEEVGDGEIAGEERLLVVL